MAQLKRGAGADEHETGNVIDRMSPAPLAHRGSRRHVSRSGCSAGHSGLELRDLASCLNEEID
jgi:transcription initiation factor TFIID subunit TAF12